MATLKTSPAKAIALENLHVIKNYIDNRVDKCLNNMQSGYDDLKIEGLPVATSTQELDLHNCGTADIYTYNHSEGFEHIKNGPASLKKPFVMVRYRYKHTDGNTIVVSNIYSVGESTSTLLDGEPMTYTSSAAYNGTTGAFISASSWTSKPTADLTEQFSVLGKTNLDESYVTTKAVGIYVSNSASVTGLPKNITVGNITSFTLRNTLVGDIGSNNNFSSAPYIIQELVVKLSATEIKSYLRILVANGDGTFKLGCDWEEKSLIDFKELSLLTLIYDLNNKINQKVSKTEYAVISNTISNMSDKVDAIEDTVATINSNNIHEYKNYGLQVYVWDDNLSDYHNPYTGDIRQYVKFTNGYFDIRRIGIPKSWIIDRITANTVQGTLVKNSFYVAYSSVDKIGNLTSYDGTNVRNILSDRKIIIDGKLVSFEVSKTSFGDNNTPHSICITIENIPSALNLRMSTSGGSTSTYYFYGDNPLVLPIMDCSDQDTIYIVEMAVNF